MVVSEGFQSLPSIPRVLMCSGKFGGFERATGKFSGDLNVDFGLISRDFVVFPEVSISNSVSKP